MFLCHVFDLYISVIILIMAEVDENLLLRWPFPKLYLSILLAPEIVLFAFVVCLVFDIDLDVFEL